MIEVSAADAGALAGWFDDERPGYGAALAGHVLSTGLGRRWVDRWPEPRFVLLAVADNFALRGAPDAVDPAALAPLLAGFVDAPAEFLPVLRRASERVAPWQRLVFTLDDRPLTSPTTVDGVGIRRLTADDAAALDALSEPSSWIYRTWGGPAGTAASGRAWGAFAEGRLASVACTFFSGPRYEDIGVITEPEYQRRGLSTACVTGLCSEIRGRGHRPSWSTSVDNIGSRRVAEKAGFTLVREDVLYAVNIEVPG